MIWYDMIWYDLWIHILYDMIYLDEYNIDYLDESDWEMYHVQLEHSYLKSLDDNEWKGNLKLSSSRYGKNDTKHLLDLEI